MKIRNKLLSAVTAFALIGSYPAVPVIAAESKLTDITIQLIEAGEESIKVTMFYEDIDKDEISLKAKELTDEYAQTLEIAQTDNPVQMEKERMKYERLVYDYYDDLNRKMCGEARNERVDSILAELGVEREDIECSDSPARIFCYLSPEQIAIAEKNELVTRISAWKPDEREIIPLTLEQLVAEDTSFANNSFIYSDKYKFSMEGNNIIVYGIPNDDSYGNWREHLKTNPEYTFGIYDWFPAGENRSAYSGFRYMGVGSMSSLFKLSENHVDVIFFVENEIPYMYETVEEASEKMGFDISQYIYSSAENKMSYVSGDVNLDGTIDIYDAVEIAKSLTGTRKFTEEEKKIADYNSDGKVDLYDAIGIAKHCLQTII